MKKIVHFGHLYQVFKAIIQIKFQGRKISHFKRYIISNLKTRIFLDFPLRLKKKHKTQGKNSKFMGNYQFSSIYENNKAPLNALKKPDLKLIG